MRPATERQLARLRELAVTHSSDLTYDEATDLLRSIMWDLGVTDRREIDPERIRSALVVESEGDPLPGVTR